MNEPFDHLINRQKRISDSTLAHAFEQRATRTPDAAAVTYGDKSLTFAELDVLANRLAHRLIACRVRRASAVGVL